jgi:hypothetical protein
LCLFCFGWGALKIKLFINAEQNQCHQESLPEPVLEACIVRQWFLPFAQQAPGGPGCGRVKQNRQPPRDTGIADTRGPIAYKTFIQWNVTPVDRFICIR